MTVNNMNSNNENEHSQTAKNRPTWYEMNYNYRKSVCVSVKLRISYRVKLWLTLVSGSRSCLMFFSWIWISPNWASTKVVVNNRQHLAERNVVFLWTVIIVLVFCSYMTKISLLGPLWTKSNARRGCYLSRVNMYRNPRMYPPPKWLTLSGGALKWPTELYSLSVYSTDILNDSALQCQAEDKK